MQTYEVFDQDRCLRFTGVLLGEASSQRPGKPRWTEVQIFKTQADQYVVHRVGRSSLPNEVDWHSSNVAEDPRGAVEFLHQVDELGSRYMTYVDRTAADRASEVDEDFAQAYKVQEVA
jgi:hypothetical protein